MAKIDELLKELCPDGVEYVSLGSICNCITGGDTPKDCIKGQKEPTAEYPYPVYSNGDAVYGYCKTYRVDKSAVTVSSIGNVGTAFYRTPFFTPIIRLKTFIPNEDSLDVKFLYFCLSGMDFIGTNSSLSSMKAADFKKIQIPLPPLPIQQHIVEVLDTFTDAISNLEEELALREKQCEYYREQLFNFDDETSLGKQLYSYLIDWQTLSEVAEIGTGSSNTKDGLSQGLFPFYTRGQDILWKNEYEFDEEAVITAGDGVGVGKTIHYVKGKYALHQRAYRFSPKKTLLGKFLFYYMKVSFYKYVCGQSVSSSVSSLRKPKLMAYPIPILPIEKQQEIVEILDTFEAMIANIKEEIALRTKQYEYYREKLLSFGK